MEINVFLERSAKEIIQKMENQFDSHMFITQLCKDFEKEYVEGLYMYKDCTGIFRTFHSVIGRFLSNNTTTLSIRKVEKVMSDNIKDYESENQKWSKIL
jgi:hypothetical protein